MKTTLYCACSSNEHQISLESDECEGVKDLYLAFHLAQAKPWYRRIVNAIKYVFGYRCKYGDFDEFLFTIETATVVKNYLDEYLGTTGTTLPLVYVYPEYPVEAFSDTTVEELNAKENNNVK